MQRNALEKRFPETLHSVPPKRLVSPIQNVSSLSNVSRLPWLKSLLWILMTSALPGFQVTCSFKVITIGIFIMTLCFLIVVILFIVIIIIIVIIECEEDDSSTHCPDFALTIDREQQCLVRKGRNILFSSESFANQSIIAHA